MINLKHLNEAVRLYPMRLDHAQAFSDYQYAKYLADEEIKKAQRFSFLSLQYIKTLNEYRKTFPHPLLK